MKKEFITLREYLLEGYDGDENDVFLSDEEFVQAESWEAHVFANKMLNKPLEQSTRQELYKAFRILVKKKKFTYNIKSEDNNIKGNKLLVNGGSKKLSLEYNENYELTNLDADY